MTKAKHMPVAPPLPSGSVDFNKLHEAALAGTAPAEALAGARVTSRSKPAAKTAPRAVTTAPMTAANQEDSTNG